MIEAPPALEIPPDYETSYPWMLRRAEPVLPQQSPAITQNAPQPRQRIAIQPQSPTYSAPPAALPISGDRTQASPLQDFLPRKQSEDNNETDTKGDRVRAGRLINPSTTVPQGTVMQAVLETALDSNRPGFARAIISRDVSSFDGSCVLIPRGSKLFGEYQADVGQGQNRALIRWRRLTRPDGVIVDVDSPSADPLGRAGVKGKVNSHFFERFSGAILQSALDLGVQLGARKASRDTYVLAIPYGTQAINPIKPEEIKPTVTVRQGTSVSVFIARDLDFTDVGG